MKTNFYYNSVLTVLTVAIIHISNGVEILRPRGVSISKASLYNPDKDFTCLDGTLTIPFLHVNDDYCDCSDGSDEPGTPACPNGTFHCTNAGHKPLDIPSSRVNDGICDCCDGTDEFDGREKLAGGFCSNSCLEQGRAAREEAQRLAELLRQGAELRLEMARQGREMQAERSKRHAQLLKDKEEADALKNERELVKKQAEEQENVVLAKYREAEEAERKKNMDLKQAEEQQEAVRLFNSLDSDNNGRVSVFEVIANKAFDQNRDGQVTEDEARFFLGESEEVSEDVFVDACWKRMKPFYMMEVTHNATPAPIEEQHSSEEEQPPESEEPEEIAGGDIDEEEEEDDREDDKEPETGDYNAQDDRQPVSVQYDEETQQIVDAATKARQDFDEADRALRDVQREVKQVEEALEKDYGPDQEFAPLDGDCFEYTDREYTYRLCPFDQAVQKPKLGGTETRLGTWGQWAGSNIDKYSKMKYEKGQACWNGPQRSTLVSISCGVENKLTAVSEPNRCEYAFDFVTPAACRISDSATEGQGHDEL